DRSSTTPSWLAGAGFDAPWDADPMTALTQGMRDEGSWAMIGAQSAFDAPANAADGWGGGLGVTDQTTALAPSQSYVIPLAPPSTSGDQQLADSLAARQQNAARPLKPFHSRSSHSTKPPQTLSPMSPSTGSSSGGMAPFSGGSMPLDPGGDSGAIRPDCDGWTTIESGGTPTGHGTV